MTTPRDLLITAVDRMPVDLGESGELSLALAGAELIDLLADGAVTLDDGNRIEPGPPRDTPDRMLAEAAASLVRELPHETVGDWLWRRGRDLSSHYMAALEAEEVLVRERRRFPFLGHGHRSLADTPERRSAGERWTSGDPVLVLLARSAGVTEPAPAAPPHALGHDETTVLAALDDAAAELEAERDRRNRRLENAAEENRRRGY